MSTNTDNMYIKMEVIGDDYNEGIQTFHIEHLPFTDKREDACTQTDGYSACKTDSVQETSTFHAPEIGSKEMEECELSYFETPFLSSPGAGRKSSHGSKDRTPKTVKLLKERHRENERLRHHSLNQHLRLICRKVPGSAEDGKETKVVMMQRIISYISYLENTIQLMCTELGLKPEPGWLMLASSVKDIEKSGMWSKDFSVINSDDSRDSEAFSSIISRRLKLSSPTIDSTTDPTSNITATTEYPDVKSDILLQESEDSCTPTSNLYLDVNEAKACDEWLMPTQEVIIDGPETFDALLSATEYVESLFELPSSAFASKLMKSPDQVTWLGSPDRSPGHQQKKSESHFGIKCDPKYLEEQACDMSHTITVSPDQVMPVTTIKQEVMQDSTTNISKFEWNSTFSSGDSNHQKLHSNKCKQSSPRRVPLLSLTKWTEVPFTSDQELHSSGESLKQELSDFSSVSKVSNFLEVESKNSFDENKTGVIEDSAEEITEEALTAEHEKVIRVASGETSGKLDLRKSSWMNGFMMYSRIHRKRFIKENPGLHTSTISRMMGQKWRTMPSEQQKPYREQARLCSQELLRMLDESCHSLQQKF